MALSIRPASIADTDLATFGLGSGFVFTINTVVGAGFLSLPWAYANGGWLLCLLLQLTFMVLSWVMCLLLLEVLSRVEAITRLREAGHTLECKSLLSVLARPTEKGKPLLSSEEPSISSRRFDIASVVRTLFGPRLAGVYVCVLYLYTLGALVAYTSIFATSFASNVPLGTEGTCDMYEDGEFDGNCRWKYLCFWALFAGCMVYFTVAGYREQLWMQITMTVMRFLVMTTVIVTCLVSIATHRSNESGAYNQANMPTLASPRHLGRALPILLFATLYHTQMPNIAEHIKNKAKNVPRVAMLTALSSCLFYSALGLVVPTAIEDVPSQSTLSYRNYSAGYSGDGKPGWTYAIEYLVVIFPALDVFSSFPLGSVALGDNLMTLMYGSVPAAAIPRRAFYVCKLLACVPPLLIAVVEFNLGELLEWTGLLGFFLMPFMIPACHLASRQMLPQRSLYGLQRWPLHLSWLLSLVQVPLILAIILLNVFF